MTLHAREAGEPGRPTALLLHGWPNSSHLWRDTLPAVAEAGWHPVAPDLLGHGDSPLDGRAGTWEDHVDALDAFWIERDLGPVALVAHDWGGLIGLRWALERERPLRALVLSCTGFFADGRWHGLAQALRGPEGEQMLASLTRTTFGAMLRASAPRVAEDALDEYWKGLRTPEGRAAALALYRSGDFQKLETLEPRLRDLAVPALLLWGGRDRFAPVAGAHRFASCLPQARLVVLEEAGHFLHEDDPERVAREIAGFLAEVSG